MCRQRREMCGENVPVGTFASTHCCAYLRMFEDASGNVGNADRPQMHADASVNTSASLYSASAAGANATLH